MRRDRRGTPSGGWRSSDSAEDGIDGTEEREGPDGQQHDSGPTFCADREPEIHAGGGNEQQQVDRAVGKPPPDASPQPIPANGHQMRSRRLVEVRDGLPYTERAP